MGLTEYPKIKAMNMMGIRQSLDLMKLRNALTDRGFAATIFDTVAFERLWKIADDCSADCGVVDVTGNAAGYSLKIRAAATESTSDVNKAQKMVEIHTKLVLPRLLEREAVPEDIVKKASGKTMNMPSFMTTSAMNAIAEMKKALSLNVSSNASPMAAAAR